MRRLPLTAVFYTSLGKIVSGVFIAPVRGLNSKISAMSPIGFAIASQCSTSDSRIR